MADFTDLVTVITILKRVLISGVQVDAETRERIKAMTTDEEVVAFARELIADTDRKAGEFIDRLEGEESPPAEDPA
jgi:hypothetical protein